MSEPVYLTYELMYELAQMYEFKCLENHFQPVLGT